MIRLPRPADHFLRLAIRYCRDPRGRETCLFLPRSCLNKRLISGFITLTQSNLGFFCVPCRIAIRYGEESVYCSTAL
jgi:hypothetical protein